MFDLTGFLQRKRAGINAALDEILSPESKNFSILEAMGYSVRAGGKRLRPILCICAAEAVGGSEHDAMPAACALELIHTYSLIHDDLPAMDDDELRRGKPTSHVKFGEGAAILAGDALLTLAFEVLSQHSDSNCGRYDAGLRLKAIHAIASSAGFRGMIEGQMMDLGNEGLSPSLSVLERLHSLKTGALIEASLVSGAILGRGTKQQIECLRRFGGKIGLAFQVKDDLLNVQGDPRELGKMVGTDAARQKSTYVSCLGEEKAADLAEKLVGQAVSLLEPFGKKADPLAAIAEYVINRNR